MDDRPTFMVTRVRVKDEKNWEEYRSQVPVTLAKWGGEVVFRGTRLEVLSGEHGYTHTLFTRFPNTAAAIKSWYEAPVSGAYPAS